MNNILEILSMAKGDPQSMYDKMIRENPQFSEFVQKNKDKRPEDIAKEYGVDPSLLNLLK